MILPFSHWFQGVRRMTVTFRKRMRLLMRRILWNSNWRNSNQPRLRNSNQPRLRSSQAQSKLIVKSLHAMPLYQSWQGTTEIAIKISKQVSKRKESSAAGTGVQYAQNHLTIPYVSIIPGIWGTCPTLRDLPDTKCRAGPSYISGRYQVSGSGP